MNWRLKLPSGNATWAHVSFAEAGHVATWCVKYNLPICLQEGSYNLSEQWLPNDDHTIQAQSLGVIS